GLLATVQAVQAPLELEAAIAHAGILARNPPTLASLTKDSPYLAFSCPLQGRAFAGTSGAAERHGESERVNHDRQVPGGRPCSSSRCGRPGLLLDSRPPRASASTAGDG